MQRGSRAYTVPLSSIPSHLKWYRPASAALCDTLVGVPQWLAPAMTQRLDAMPASLGVREGVADLFASQTVQVILEGRHRAPPFLPAGGMAGKGFTVR